MTLVSNQLGEFDVGQIALRQKSVFDMLNTHLFPLESKKEHMEDFFVQEKKEKEMKKKMAKKTQKEEEEQNSKEDAVPNAEDPPTTEPTSTKKQISLFHEKKKMTTSNNNKKKTPTIHDLCMTAAKRMLRNPIVLVINQSVDQPKAIPPILAALGKHLGVHRPGRDLVDWPKNLLEAVKHVDRFFPGFLEFVHYTNSPRSQPTKLNNNNNKKKNDLPGKATPQQIITYQASKNVQSLVEKVKSEHSNGNAINTVEFLTGLVDAASFP